MILLLLLLRIDTSMLLLVMNGKISTFYTSGEVEGDNDEDAEGDIMGDSDRDDEGDDKGRKLG